MVVHKISYIYIFLLLKKSKWSQRSTHDGKQHNNEDDTQKLINSIDVFIIALAVNQ